MVPLRGNLSSSCGETRSTSSPLGASSKRKTLKSVPVSGSCSRDCIPSPLDAMAETTNSEVPSAASGTSSSSLPRVRFHHAVKKPSLRWLSCSKPSKAAFGLPQSSGGLGGLLRSSGGGWARPEALAAPPQLLPLPALVELPPAVQLASSLLLAGLASAVGRAARLSVCTSRVRTRTRLAPTALGTSSATTATNRPTGTPQATVRIAVLQQHLQLRLFHGETAVASDVKAERSEPTSQSLLSSLLRRASPISATIGFVVGRYRVARSCAWQGQPRAKFAPGGKHGPEHELLSCHKR